MPHSTTGQSPAELALGQKLRTQIPDMNMMKHNDSRVCNKDKCLKDKMKVNADKQSHGSVKPAIEIGDKVLVQQPKKNKLAPPYDPDPHVVTGVKGLMVTASRLGDRRGTVTCNQSQFKRIPLTVPIPKHNSREEDDLDDIPLSREDHANDKSTHIAPARPNRHCTSPPRNAGNQRRHPVR